MATKKKTKSSTKAKVKTPKLNEGELAANYGFALATLNSDPELKALFKRAVKERFEPARFVAEVRGLNWFKNQSEQQRNYAVLRASDPSQYVAQVQQVMASLADQYSGLTGEVLASNGPTVQNGQVVNGSGFLFDVADQALRFGWNEAQTKDHLTASVDWRSKIQQHTLTGSSLGQLDSWRSTAASYGVQPTDDWFADQLKSVNNGSNTTEGVVGALKDQSKQRYTAFASQIDGGATVQDLAENYRQSYGNVLEVAPAQVDVFDKHIQAALTNKDPDGKDSPMSVSDFEKRLRQDDRWQFTQNAKEAVVGRTHSLLSSLGLTV